MVSPVAGGQPAWRAGTIAQRIAVPEGAHGNPGLTLDGLRLEQDIPGGVPANGSGYCRPDDRLRRPPRRVVDVEEGRCIVRVR